MSDAVIEKVKNAKAYAFEKKSDAMDEKIKEITNFHFPFILYKFHDESIDEMIEAVRFLIKDANKYIEFLEKTKEPIDK